MKTPEKEKCIRVLLTGVGAPGTQGTIFCIKNNPEKLSIHFIGIDTDENAVGRFFVDRFYTVPSPEDEKKYFTEIQSIATHEKIDIIIPQTSKETMFYAENRPKLESLGIKVLVVSNEAALTANNKYFTLQKFKEEGLPVPNYFLVNNISELNHAAETLDYPKKMIVVKIPVANGSRGLRILSEKKLTLDKFLKEKPETDHMTLKNFLTMFENSEDSFPTMLVMEYLPGKEYSVDIFRDKKEICIIPRDRKKIRSGISFSNEIINHKKIIQISKIACEKMGLFGVFGFQFKLDDDKVPKILECNARVQGTMAASYFVNTNIIWYGIAHTLNIPYTINNNPKWGSYFFRYWGGIGINKNMVEYEII